MKTGLNMKTIERRTPFKCHEPKWAEGILKAVGFGAFILLICAVILLCTVSMSNAADVTLTWDPPKENIDKTPLADLAGYKLYQGNKSGSYGPPVDAGLVTLFKLTGLAEGEYFFVVTAYDTSGNESGYSNEKPTKIAIPPMPPELKSAIVVIVIP